MNIESMLQDMGLSQSEAKVYLALLELGVSLAGDITKEAKINRSNCYDALERLIEKGLVSYVIKANRKYFQAETPQKLVELLKEEQEKIKSKQQTLREALPQLFEKREISHEKPEATVYKGKKGIQSIFEEILRHKEYWAFGSSGKFKEILDPYFTHFQNKVKKQRIKCKLIVSESARGNSITKHAETRYLPEGYLSLISTIVYANKVAIISWTKNPTGFVLEDKQTADSYHSYFEFMWNRAKK